MAICGYIEGKFLHFPLLVLPVCFAAGNRQRPKKPLPPAKALPVPCIIRGNNHINTDNYIHWPEKLHLSTFMPRATMDFFGFRTIAHLWAEPECLTMSTPVTVVGRVRDSWGGSYAGCSGWVPYHSLYYLVPILTWTKFLISSPLWKNPKTY